MANFGVFPVGEVSISRSSMQGRCISSSKLGVGGVAAQW